MNLAEIFNRLTMSRALLLGLALAAVYYFAAFDDGSAQRAAIAQGNQQLTELATQMAENQRKLDQAAVYKRTVAEVGGTINRLLSLVPEKFSVPELMQLISNEAKVAGSSLSTLTPKEIQVSALAKEFEELSVSLELNGTFLQHMTFLANLTKINQILVVRRFGLAMTKEGHGEEPTQTKMVADIVAYRYRGGQPAPKEVTQ